MGHNFSIIDVFKELPLDEMQADAKELKIDYKSKKLDSMTLFALLAQGYLMTERLSQRYVCKEANLLSLNDLYGISVYNGSISHSSLSERLSVINPKFFEDTYKLLYKKVLAKYGFYPLAKSNIVRVDTTYVAETANKLLEGIKTGVNDRYGGVRKQIKYGIAYDGFGVLVADIFSKQNESGDDVALAATVKSAISHNGSSCQVYTFDRGVSSAKNLKEIDSLTKSQRDTFVGRMKLGRLFNVIKERGISNVVDPDGEYEILQDCEAHLRKQNSEKWDESATYRIIRVRFVNPRPKSAGAASHLRKYQSEMLLITNDFVSDAITIANEYKARWSIEVFFKFLKQNLSFAHLLSVNLNGIKVMLYMTLIMALLVKLFELETCQGPKMAILDMKIQIANWLYLNNLKGGHKCNDDYENTQIYSSKDVFRPL